ncbi:hypothetical protein T484DRAFT_1795615 [Baffinella frigidus]|nr:hypothetical protein T484DRAFT_1795615 [Cryptophyta sp. CCMP2293]
MTASAVFILDLKGKVIISRNYRGDVPMIRTLTARNLPLGRSCAERFATLLLDEESG